MKHAFRFLFLVLFSFSFLAQAQDYPAFDRGPNPDNPMHRELIELFEELPNIPGMSEVLDILAPSYKKGQKFRPDFGAMPMRGLLEENSVQVLAIGQDGTHIAEGANRPGIAGFGGRVHDMLKHFGVFEGVVFTNLFVNTISGQYGSRNTPVLVNGEKVQFQNVIENRLWLLTHESAYSEWRNRLISWVIRNNQDSLKMMMVFGQAGKDAAANYVNSIGGEVSARKSVGNGAHIKVPVFRMVGAGGNNEWAVPLDEKGRDIAEVLRQSPSIRKNLKEKLTGKKETLRADLRELSNKNNSSKARKIKSKIDYFQKRIAALDEKLDYKDGTRQYGISTDNAKDLLQDNAAKVKEMMVFTESGPQGNGILRAQQLGGWDLETMKVDGETTRSIKGLKISDGKGGFITAPDVVVTGAPHPTWLSMSEMQNKGSAAKAVEKQLLIPLKRELARGWTPPTPEPGLKSHFPNEPYRYSRGAIPVSHGDPGITDLRLLPVSTARREGSSTIVIGTRNRVNFDKSKIREMEKAQPSQKWLAESGTILTGRPQIEGWSFEYDRGPNQTYTDLLYRSLDKQETLWVKDSLKSEAEDLIDSYYKEEKIINPTQLQQEDAYSNVVNKMFKPEAGFFGHYRGTFESPRVIILADPDGVDSFITSKAASGKRGQFLNGLMNDLEMDDKYLVLSTVPFGMDEASPEEWEEALEKTKQYRENLLNQLLKDNKPKVVLADGENAAKELERILGDYPFIKIQKTNNFSEDMKNAGRQISELDSFSIDSSRIKGEMIDIPRTHLTWLARSWEGTSGDRVITAIDKEVKGKAFAIVAPKWATQNEVEFKRSTNESLERMLKKLDQAGDIMPREGVIDYLERKAARRVVKTSSSCSKLLSNFIGL